MFLHGEFRVCGDLQPSTRLKGRSAATRRTGWMSEILICGEASSAVTFLHRPALDYRSVAFGHEYKTSEGSNANGDRGSAGKSCA